MDYYRTVEEISEAAVPWCARIGEVRVREDRDGEEEAFRIAGLAFMVVSEAVEGSWTSYSSPSHIEECAVEPEGRAEVRGLRERVAAPERELAEQDDHCPCCGG